MKSKTVAKNWDSKAPSAGTIWDYLENIRSYSFNNVTKTSIQIFRQN